jgi:hypothetical protein
LPNGKATHSFLIRGDHFCLRLEIMRGVLRLKKIMIEREPADGERS